MYVITLSLQDVGDGIDCEYKSKSEDVDDSINDPYGADIMEADI